MPITHKSIIDKLNTLKNILLLEKAQDYSDSAVIGGLDRFIGKLRDDLNSPEIKSSHVDLPWTVCRVAELELDVDLDVSRG